MASPLSHFLYLSHLSRSCGVDGLGPLVRQARQLNQAAGLTGLLVFDGHHFVQYLEGATPALQALVPRLARDERHSLFTPLLPLAPLPGPRRFQNWSMAYAEVHDELGLRPLAALHGEAALQALLAQLPQLDLQP